MCGPLSDGDVVTRQKHVQDDATANLKAASVAGAESDMHVHIHFSTLRRNFSADQITTQPTTFRRSRKE
jgi:hypothetical protein